MTPTCKTCRYWEAEYKACHKCFVDVPNDIREFKENTIRVSVYPDGMRPGQSVAYVFTGPDFGCVHWKEREDACPN